MTDKQNFEKDINVPSKEIITGENLCDDCLRRLDTNPIRILDCKSQSCQNILKDAPLITQNLNQICNDDFNKLQEILKANGGVLNFTYKSDAEDIKNIFAMSKKAFKATLTKLIDEKKITINGNVANNDTKNPTMFYYIKGTEPTYNNESLESLIPTIKNQE